MPPYLTEYLLVGLVFCAGGILANGLTSNWWRSRKATEVVTNSKFFFLDALLIAPLCAALVTALSAEIPTLVDLSHGVPFSAQLVVAVLFSDLSGYWRHRLLHTPALWPSHAVHHSDRHIHWLTLIRIHPVERLVTATVDCLTLSLLGFDPAVVAANGLLRHYYGYVLHADIKGHFGILRYVFVTPHFHRWHHSDLKCARGKNFAVIFSFIDLAFGSFFCPKASARRLGTAEVPQGVGLVPLLLHPFKAAPAKPHLTQATGIRRDCDGNRVWNARTE